MWLLLATWVLAQPYSPQGSPAPAKSSAAGTNTPPHSPDEAGESSSKDTKIDLSPPKSDSKEHPNSGVADEALGQHPYDPHKAEKAIEIGDFYFRRDNYKAALDRYQEALQWKPNDAVATFKLAEALEKLGRIQEARVNFQAYLKILPDGPEAKKARKALSKLPPAAADSARKPQAGNSAPVGSSPQN